jgi:tetratricopeptide (TPR) repeat protein
MNDTQVPLVDSYEGLYARAQSVRASGNLEEAMAVFRRLTDRLARLTPRILERRPELRNLHRAARMELAWLLRHEGRYSEAIDVLHVLLDSHPEEARLWRRELATLRVARGDVESGLADLQALAEEAPDEAAGWLILGREARIEGRFGLAREAVDRALEVCQPRASCPELARIHRERFEFYRAAGQVDEALAAWEEAAARDEEARKGISEVSVMLADAGRYSEARAMANRDPNSLRAGLQRGHIDRLVGNAGEARKEWRRVADLNPDEFEYGHEAWVEAMLRLGEAEGALEWLQDALRERFSIRLLILSGVAWAMYGDAEVAANLFQQAVGLLRYQRPPKKKLDSSDWRLLDSLVTDEEIKKALKPYFAVVETLWR